MKTKINTFISEEQLNDFLNEERKDKNQLNLIRELIDIKVTGDGYQGAVLYHLIYKTNEDDLV